MTDGTINFAESQVEDLRQALLDHARLINHAMVDGVNTNNPERVEELVNQQLCVLSLLEDVTNKLRAKKHAKAPKKGGFDDSTVTREEFQKRITREVGKYFQYKREVDEPIDLYNSTMMDFGVYMQLQYGDDYMSN